MSINCDMTPVGNFKYDIQLEKPSQEDSSSKSNAPFTEVSLQTDIKKQPKRILHFSDGVLEEYSTDDELDANEAKPPVLVNNTVADTKTMTWSVYLWYLTLTLGTKTLSVCDYLGENLAHFFGITTPKYQYEIDEYQRMIQEEDDLRRQDEEDSVGWVSSKNSTVTVEQGLSGLSLNLSPPILMEKKVSSSLTTTPLQRF